MQVPDPAKKQRLRIAVLNRRFTVTGGGAERYSIALVEQLAAHHDIHVFAQHIDHQWPGVIYHQVSCLSQRPRWFNQLWYATATWWATRKGFDVVHSHENTWHGQVQTVHVLPVKYNLFHGRTGAALLLRWLKVLTSPRLWVYLGFERCRYSAVPRRIIVLASSSLIGQVLEAYPGCQSVIKVITPGVNFVGSRITAEQQLLARQRLGLPTAGICVLFVGNDYRKKGLTTLIAALAQLPADCFLAVVGNPDQIPQFKTQASILQLSQRVFFLGTCKIMDDVYHAADCLAHPTLEDTFAMVVLEAMSHGLPVVVSNERYCGISALLIEGENALILRNPKDQNELSKRLNDLVSDAILRQSLGNAAVAFSREYQWPAIASKQEAIYYSVFNSFESIGSDASSSCRPSA